MRFVPRIVLPAIVSLLVTFTLQAAERSGSRSPTNKDECLKVSEDLYAGAARAGKRTHIVVPREFFRVASNLDDFCEQGDFQKAAVSIEWMETCIRNLRKKYSEGFCRRTKRYFCATFPELEGCRAVDGAAE